MLLPSSPSPGSEPAPPAARAGCSLSPRVAARLPARVRPGRPSVSPPPRSRGRGDALHPGNFTPGRPSAARLLPDIPNFVRRWLCELSLEGRERRGHSVPRPPPPFPLPPLASGHPAGAPPSIRREGEVFCSRLLDSARRPPLIRGAHKPDAGVRALPAQEGTQGCPLGCPSGSPSPPPECGDPCFKLRAPGDPASCSVARGGRGPSAYSPRPLVSI